MHHKKRHGQNSRPRISPFLSIYEEKNWGIVYDPWCFPNHRSPASAWPVFYSGTLQPTAWNDIICQDLKWNYKRWDHLFGKNAGLAFSRISQLSCAASWQSVFSEDNPLKKVSIKNLALMLKVKRSQLCQCKKIQTHQSPMWKTLGALAASTFIGFSRQATDTSCNDLK